MKNLMVLLFAICTMPAFVYADSIGGGSVDDLVFRPSSQEAPIHPLAKRGATCVTRLQISDSRILTCPSQSLDGDCSCQVPATKAVAKGKMKSEEEARIFLAGFYGNDGTGSGNHFHADTKREYYDECEGAGNFGVTCWMFKQTGR